MLRKDHSNSRKRVPSAALRLAQEGQQGEDGERSVSQRNSLSFSPSKSRPRGQVATFEWLRGARREVRYQEFRELMVRKHADREQLLARPIWTRRWRSACRSAGPTRGVRSRDKAGKADSGRSPTLRLRTAQPLQGHLGGIFLGLVDVLAVVPEARRHAHVADVDAARPGGTSSCARSSQRQCFKGKKCGVGAGGGGQVSVLGS